MLFCRVTLGKSFLQFSAMKMAHAPPGHHSVIGRPSVNGLAYAEYVIYRGEQVNTDGTSFFPQHCLSEYISKNICHICCVILYLFSFRPSQSTSSPTRSLNQRVQPSLLQELSRSHSHFTSHTQGHNACYPLYCKCLNIFIYQTHFQ